MAESVVLYIEDEENDVLLLRLAFKRVGLPNLLKSVADGVEAIDYLAGNGPFADREQNPFPSLVLLDLNLPRMSGFEILEWIGQQPAITSLPVVIYTSSNQSKDRDRARQLGAVDYIVKRSSLNEIAEAVRDLARCWLPQASR